MSSKYFHLKLIIALQNHISIKLLLSQKSENLWQSKTTFQIKYTKVNEKNIINNGIYD